MIHRIFLIWMCIGTCSYAFSWQDLWSTKNQQAQVLMNRGDYSQAGKMFERPDWQAAAAYRSGNYQHAADLYQALHNENSYYNQGNALAHMGQYEKAINAYNKTLAINPNNQDALANRKVVEDLLKKQKEQQQDQNKQDQNKQDQNKQDQNKQDQNKQDQNKQDQNKQDQNKQDQNKQDQNKQDQNKQDQNKQDQNKQDQNKQDQNKQDQNKQDQNKQDQNKQDQNKQDQNKQDQNKQDNQQPQNTQSSSLTQAEREQQQTKMQSLQLVPDDPGGLLREKFMRDHLRRQLGWPQ